jgi:predicted transcriptional regulator
MSKDSHHATQADSSRSGAENRSPVAQNPGYTESQDVAIENPEQVLSEVKDLPPSAKLVLKVIVYEGRCTHKQLKAETRLDPRTIRNAAKSLLETGILDERKSLTDARQSVYSLVSTDPLPEEFLRGSKSD